MDVMEEQWKQSVPLLSPEVQERHSKTPTRVIQESNVFRKEPSLKREEQKSEGNFTEEREIESNLLECFKAK